MTPEQRQRALSKIDENREELEGLAATDGPAAWIAQELLDELEEEYGGDSDGPRATT